MLPACLRLADDVFPQARAQAARRLAAAGWTQQRTAQALGLSQAMVSKHLAAKGKQPALATRLGDELADDLLAPTGPEGQPSWCATLAATADPAADNALQDLLAAERSLLAEPPLRLVPQVGLNLAVALPDATGPDGVLAYPGRLVEANGRLVRPAPPAFGGSGHLARVLLALRARTDAGALANVRGGRDVLAAARRAGLAVRQVQRSPDDAAEATTLAAIAALAPAAHVDAVHDPGAIGLEPCLYVAGPDARAIVTLLQRLHSVMPA